MYRPKEKTSIISVVKNILDGFTSLGQCQEVGLHFRNGLTIRQLKSAFDTIGGKCLLKQF
jgi:hypothetical protein